MPSLCFFDVIHEPSFENTVLGTDERNTFMKTLRLNNPFISFLEDSVKPWFLFSILEFEAVAVLAFWIRSTSSSAFNGAGFAVFERNI